VENPRSGRRKLNTADLKRGWDALPIGWKVAAAVALAWLIVVPTVLTPLILAGHRLPITWRVIEAASKFVALGTVMAAAWTSCRRLSVSPTGREIALQMVFIVGLAYVFLSPVFH
jgi:hypothetical protein